MSVQSSRTSSLLAITGLAGLALFPLLFGSRKKQRAATGWIDITAGLSSATIPIYEGDPPLRMEWAASIEKDGVNVTRYSMGAHTGTHMDAPLHFIAGGAAIDEVPLDILIGPARVIEIPPEIEAITAAVLKQFKWKGAPRILFKTKSSSHGWMHNPLFQKVYPFITPDAARLMVKRGVQLVGVDYLSVEKFDVEPETHRTLLANGVLILEGLDLSEVDAGDYELIVLPLRLAGREAAPARALLRRIG
jgi:arylformamidase